MLKLWITFCRKRGKWQIFQHFADRVQKVFHNLLILKGDNGKKLEISLFPFFTGVCAIEALFHLDEYSIKLPDFFVFYRSYDLRIGDFCRSFSDLFVRFYCFLLFFSALRRQMCSFLGDFAP